MLWPLQCMSIIFEFYLGSNTRLVKYFINCRDTSKSHLFKMQTELSVFLCWMLEYKVKWQTNTRFSHKEAGRPIGRTLSPISYGLTRRIADLGTVAPWLWNFEVPSEPYMEIITWDTCFICPESVIQWVVDGTELISRPSLCSGWQALLCLAVRKEVSLGRAPFQAKCPCAAPPRPKQSLRQCFGEHPGLRSLPSGWAFPNALR